MRIKEQETHLILHEHDDDDDDDDHDHDDHDGSIYRCVFDIVTLRYGYEEDTSFVVFAGRTRFEFTRTFSVFTAIFVSYPLLSGDIRVLSKKRTIRIASCLFRLFVGGSVKAHIR